jgi:hypothetical protein
LADPQNQHPKYLILEEECTRASASKNIHDLYERNIPNAPADTSISGVPQNQQRKELPLEEGHTQASESKYVLGLFKSNLPEPPADTSMSVDQQNQQRQQRKELPSEEELNRPRERRHVLKHCESIDVPTSDKKVDGIQKNTLSTVSADKFMSAHQNRKDLDRKGMNLPQSSYQRMYPKIDLTINWKFLLLLTITILGYVSADSDCEKMNSWIPAMFNATGTECCFQTGITCSSDRITVM